MGWWIFVQICLNFAACFTGSWFEALLVTAADIEDEHQRMCLLVGLAHYLPETLVIQALNVAKDMRDPEKRLEAMTSLIPCLSKSEQVQWLPTFFELVDTTENATLSIKVVIDLMDILPETLKERELNKVWEMIARIDNPVDRALRLSELIPNLPPPVQKQALKNILTIIQDIRDIQDVGYKDPLLISLVPNFTAEVPSDVLKSVLQVESTDNRSKMLGVLVETLVGLEIPLLHSHWHEMLHTLSGRTRADLLTDLRVLAPVIQKLGGESAIEETFHAIQDVEKWWA
jgi:hypothetical protein